MQKIKLVFVPFLLIAICVIGGYTLLNWLFIIKLHIVSVNEEVINLWVPFVLALIPVLIWLRPRIKLLSLKDKKGNLPFLYIFAATLAIGIPTAITQLYIETATGKLTKLYNVNQIDKQEATKYYTLTNFYIDKAHPGVKNSFEVSGKHNEYFNMGLHVALPIFASPADTLKSTCLAWYGIKYQKQISNRLSGNEKEAQFKDFLRESQNDFDNKDVNQFSYLDRIGVTNDHKKYIAAIENNKMFSTNATTILIPVNEPFEARNGNKLVWIFLSLGIGIAVWFIMVIIPKFDTVSLRKFNKGIVNKSTGAKDLLSFFIFRKTFFVTPIIIGINCLVFIIMVFAGLGFISFQASDLLNWGANYRPVTTDGEWWRLVTNIFLHGGLMHLLSNMYGLLFVGIFLEPKLGRAKYTIAYLITGIIASLASLWWHSATVSVGASGAIFGLYGVFLALLITKKIHQSVNQIFLVNTLIFIGYNLLMGFTGGIDNAAHIGGLVSGFVIGLIFYPRLKQDSIEDEKDFLQNARTKHLEETHLK